MDPKQTLELREEAAALCAKHGDDGAPCVVCVQRLADARRAADAASPGGCGCACPECDPCDPYCGSCGARNAKPVTDRGITRMACPCGHTWKAGELS